MHLQFVWVGGPQTGTGFFFVFFFLIFQEVAFVDQMKKLAQSKAAVAVEVQHSCSGLSISIWGVKENVSHND